MQRAASIAYTYLDTLAKPIAQMRQCKFCVIARDCEKPRAQRQLVTQSEEAFDLFFALIPRRVKREVLDGSNLVDIDTYIIVGQPASNGMMRYTRGNIAATIRLALTRLRLCARFTVPAKYAHSNGGLRHASVKAARLRH